MGTSATSNFISTMLATGTIDFQAMFSLCDIDIDPSKIRSQVLENLKTNPKLRSIFLELSAQLKENAELISQVRSIYGHIFIKEIDPDLFVLMNSPGEIDWNPNYNDGTTYQDANKAKLLLKSLNKYIPDHSDPRYKYILALFRRFHTHLGISNQNFMQITTTLPSQDMVEVFNLNKHEESVARPSSLEIKLIADIVADFAEQWQVHLREIKGKIESSKDSVAILTSSGGTAHQSAAAITKHELEEQGLKVEIINETSDLSNDPLSLCIGFAIGLNYNEIKQKAGDEELYHAVSNIARFVGTIVPDQRMDELRSKVAHAKTILSVNTFAHDTRLAADGHSVWFDVIDAGQVNGKCIGLVKQICDFDIHENLRVITHPPLDAAYRDYKQHIHLLPDAKAFVRAKYPVYDVQGTAAEFMQRFSGAHDRKLTVLTFGGQGSLGQAEPFLQAFLDHNFCADGKLDVVFLAGNNYAAYIEQIKLLLGSSSFGVCEKQYSDGERIVNYTQLNLASGKCIKILPWVDQEIMGLLQLSCDQYICKPGAGTANELYARKAKGVIVIFNPNYWWEAGNCKMLANAAATMIHADHIEAPNLASKLKFGTTLETASITDKSIAWLIKDRLRSELRMGF